MMRAFFLMAFLGTLWPLYAPAQSPGPRPAPPTPEVQAYLGHYGSGVREVIVFEEAGRLFGHADSVSFPLEEVSPRTFVRGRARVDWLGDTLRFEPPVAGRMIRFQAGDRVYSRRAVGPAEGDVFRITPSRPVDELLRASFSQQMPAFPPTNLRADLVDLAVAVPGLQFDLRYARSDNFMGAPMYDRAVAALQRPAAEALARVQRELASYGLGLVIFDAYRPWHVTWTFFQAVPQDLRGFVANPARGSRHNRGAAVDLGLVDLETGRPVEMPSDFDEFNARADVRYPGGTALSRWHRTLLIQTMRRNGFSVLPGEWWHFDFRGWQAYPIMNIPLEAVEGRR